MGLKQDVVVVNEYTIKTDKGGTRGGTPGDYVTRYMSRSGAIEGVTPICRDTENFITRYMAREEAVDTAVSRKDLKEKLRDIQGQGGVAFGYGKYSLSDTELKAAARDIQKNFDKGKTVLKTVLSFDEDYLRKYNIIDPSFVFKKEGDYRGNIDQMKLRMAIMSGIDRLGRNYDDLQYIGVIQVDTKHVHCHLAMVDRGDGNVMPDGTQRGKLTDKDKAIIRRGIDNYLDDEMPVKMMTANIDQDRRNTICFVKKYTHQAMHQRGLSQFLLSCLPEDRNTWRAGTHRKEMRKPNAIVREYVEELLQQPDSGYEEAMQHIGQYAARRMKSENLTGRQYRDIVRNGQNRIIERSMNAVYDVLKKIPESEFTEATPFMDAMSMDYEDMARNSDDGSIMEFGFKLRSYKNRLDHHKNEMNKYHKAAKQYESQENKDPSSTVLYDYFKVEEEYNAMVMAKYQYFLSFVPMDGEYMDDLNSLNGYAQHVENLNRMKEDTTITRLSPDNAEAYGQRVYDTSGGRYMITDPTVIDRRIETLQERYDTARSDLSVKLAGFGMALTSDNTVQKHIAYDFDDVKALDLHHLMYDFNSDIRISMVNIDAFSDMAHRRKEAFDKAKDYLENSGQSDLLRNFPEADITSQVDFAERFSHDPLFRSERQHEHVDTLSKKTVRLDSLYYHEQEEMIKNMIKSTVNSLQYE